MPPLPSTTSSRPTERSIGVVGPQRTEPQYPAGRWQPAAAAVRTTTIAACRPAQAVAVPAGLMGGRAGAGVGLSLLLYQAAGWVRVQAVSVVLAGAAGVAGAAGAAGAGVAGAIRPGLQPRAG